MYRVCKVFDIESGHMISKHPSRCRFPHGHTRWIELVLAAETLNDQDMVVDFKWVKLAVQELLDRLDHAMCINSDDELLPQIQAVSERIVIFDGVDPSTEVIARYVFDHLERMIAEGEPLGNDEGRYEITPGVRLERVRVSETPTTWAEYSRDA